MSMSMSMGMGMGMGTGTGTGTGTGWGLQARYGASPRPTCQRQRPVCRPDRQDQNTTPAMSTMFE